MLALGACELYVVSVQVDECFVLIVLDNDPHDRYVEGHEPALLDGLPVQEGGHELGNLLLVLLLLGCDPRDVGALYEHVDLVPPSRMDVVGRQSVL